MGVYSKALRHVDNKDFRKTHQRRFDEQKVLRKIEREKKLQERKEIEEIKKLSLPFKSDWRSELFVEEEYIGEVEQTKINVKVPERLKSNWRRDLDEAMSSKDFEYLYGMSISDIQISSVLNNVQQNTTAQDILQASSDFVSYQFGKDFPGSFINSVGDNQINSQTNVDVVAFLDTSYGNVSGTDQSYRLTTGPEGLPPEGQSPPGSVVSRVNLETALGITLPSGVPNGALNGTPIEGSAIKRIFTDARPGRRINFNWTFASSEDFLGAATVDDYAFVAIKGNVTKFVSVLTRGLQYGGQFVYTVQPEDIVDGKVEIGIGVIDVFDPYVQTALNISNFGSFWGAGTLGDTTDAADLGMSVAAGTPQSQQKKEAEKEKTQQQTKVEKTVAQYQTSVNNFVSELENLEKAFNDLKQADESGYPTSMQDKFDKYMNDQKYREALYYGDAPEWTTEEREAYGFYYSMKTARQAAVEFQKQVSSGKIKVSEKTYNARITEYLRNAESAEKQLIDKFGFTSSDKPPSLTSQQQEKISKEIEKLKAAAKQSAIDARNNELAAVAVAGGATLIATLAIGGLIASTAVAVPSAAARVSAALDALKKSADAAKAARAAAARSMGQNSKGTGMGDRWSGPQFNSYQPQGEVISEKSSPKKLKSVQQALYQGQPSPNGFPDAPPPKMVNGYHPDFGQKDNMYNTLDKTSADSMPLTGNEKIDKKIKAARKQPK